MPVAPAPPVERRGRAIAFRLGAASGFAIMAALIKVAADRGVPVLEIMFWRFCFGIVPLLGYMALHPGARNVRTRNLPAQVWRAALGLASMFATFRALQLLPLAEATTIGFAAPLFAIAFSALFLGEQVGWRRWSAVAAGFVGVLIVADPGAQQLSPAGLLLAVAGAAGVAAVTVTIRRIGRTETPETTVFWFSVLSLAVLGALTWGRWAPHDPGTWVVLLGLGVAGGLAQMFMTAALGLARISVVAPFDYMQLVWAVLFGWAIWGTVPTAQTWAGAAVIGASGVYSAYRERKLQRLAAARAAAG